MPRYSSGLTKVPITKLAERAAHYRVRGLSGFIDRFPLGFGTLPEKIVYDALSRRGIPFYYLNDIRLTVPEINFDQFFQADFILPVQRIIIEVQGARWHSMEKTIESDAFKFALYQQDGWRPLAWWDFDIEADITKLFLADPVLSQFSAIASSGSSELTPVRRTKTDTSQGIRTLNSRRGSRLLYRKKAPRVKAGKLANYGSYGAMNK
jgi:G:T-mismatch repair DNA endonuclease (very short patch repair protein)